ncbi:MAG TPA: hypothetical protein RMH99_08715 [Sandaracinaceae bacterium LLY-WYZ-13_1]|nr:hypothetical protein [Sandaracinaceae bacterium LLY-WYZ-13_1]
MVEPGGREAYLDWLAEKLDDPDAYVRFLADKLAREELDEPKPPRRSDAEPD